MLHFASSGTLERPNFLFLYVSVFFQAWPLCVFRITVFSAVEETIRELAFQLESRQPQGFLIMPRLNELHCD